MSQRNQKKEFEEEMQPSSLKKQPMEQEEQVIAEEAEQQAKVKAQESSPEEPLKTEDEIAEEGQIPGQN